MNKLFFFIFLTILISCKSNIKDSIYLPFAMSHNDYQQEHPLNNALTKGFACVEADIHLKDGELYVAHTNEEIDVRKTLKSLYLDPILEMVKNDYVTDIKPLYLYIDLKTKGETFEVLCEQLKAYHEILAFVDSDGFHPNKVKVITRYWDDMKHLKQRYTFAQAMIEDIDMPLPSTSVALINERWGNCFTWRGIGEMPVEEELKLRSLVLKANKKGRLLRFWETDFETKEARLNLWNKLYECKVQLISTHYLDEFANNFQNSKPIPQPNENFEQVDVAGNSDDLSLLVNDELRLVSGKVTNGNHSVSSHITDNNVIILRQDFTGSNDTTRFNFQKINLLEEGMAFYLFGDWESWTKPIVYNQLTSLPDQEIMFTLWKHTDGMYGAMMPLCGADQVTHLSGGNDGIGTVSIDWTNDAANDVPFMAVAFSDDPYKLVHKLYQEGMQQMDRSNNLRMYKPYPDIFESFGWCTWNAMYEKVSEEKIVDGVQSFQKKGVKTPWLLIDDGWLCIDDQKRLTSLQFDKNKFPNGIKPVIENLKDNYGVKSVGVWHTMNGYWSGVNASLIGNDLKKNIQLYRDKSNVHDSVWSEIAYYSPSPIQPMGQEFYSTWYDQLKTQGISFVKVDQQSVIKRLALGLQAQSDSKPGYWSVATGMERGLQRSAQKYFDGRIINCQNMAIEALYNMSGSAIIRNSDDFFPERTAYYSLEVEKGNAAAHVVMNIHNSLWTSQIAWPDYDMFQSHHVDAEYHAILRAISGGPVYVSDYPHQQNEKILKRLIDEDGRVLRADQPALPTRDCLFTINKNTPFKAFSMTGEAGLLAIWNTDDNEEVEGQWSPGDVEGIKGDWFVAYNPINEQYHYNISKSDKITIQLARMEMDYWNILKLQSGCAVIGFVNKYNAAATVLSTVISDNKISTIVEGNGKLVIALPSSPKEILIDGIAYSGEFEFNKNILYINLKSESRKSLVQVEI